MKKWYYALGVIGLCALAWLGFRYLPDYTPGWVKSYHGLEKQGIVFAEPYLVVYGKKDRDMKLTIWTRYASMSDACRGAHIMDSDRVTEYIPGSPKAKSMGVAMRLITVPRGITDYEVAIPQNIDGPWGAGQCNWDNFETEIYMNNTYQGYGDNKKATSLFFTITHDWSGVGPLQRYYRLLCKKFYIDRPKEELYGDGQLMICRHPGQKSFDTPITLASVKQGAKARIDFVMSGQEPQPFYPDAKRDFFNKKVNPSDWDYFLTDEEFLQQSR